MTSYSWFEDFNILIRASMIYFLSSEHNMSSKFVFLRIIGFVFFGKGINIFHFRALDEEDIGLGYDA